MMTLFDWMEDFDNAELGDFDRREQLEDAVRDYNRTNGTSHDPAKSFLAYEKGKPNPYKNEP